MLAVEENFLDTQILLVGFGYVSISHLHVYIYHTNVGYYAQATWTSINQSIFSCRDMSTPQIQLIQVGLRRKYFSIYTKSLELKQYASSFSLLYYGGVQ